MIPPDNSEPEKGNSIELSNCQEISPECDRMNVQCNNSSDFIVDKQTTFNGSMTIINYDADGCKQRGDDKFKPSKEEIFVRKNIVTPLNVSAMNAVTEEKKDRDSNGDKIENNQLLGYVKTIFTGKIIKIPIVLSLLFFSFAIVGVLVFLLRRINKDSRVPEKFSASKTITYQGRVINFYSKSDWMARPPTSAIKMKTPVPYVVISHLATKFCHEQTTCMELLRNIQADQMNRSPPFADISYNFLVGGDGNVYEGRGWKTKNSITGFAGDKNIDVNFIGDFEFDAPTLAQTEAAKALIEYGVNNSYLNPNYSLIAANSTAVTLSPGVQVYKEIKTWPHFDPCPESHLKE